ncbi:MAG: hypothetical protein A2070_03720 [Bdellovibrionales bacterium GWC1_52_8]|nr:MAG: hypothetical protein A2070_03720 [Bdellovibrionales bacterium GWC1_52_8]
MDADAIRFARYGFSMNCTNDYALKESKINLVVGDMGNLIPLLEDIQAGRFNMQSPGRYSGVQLFSAADVIERFEVVKGANKEMKGALKATYSEGH